MRPCLVSCFAVLAVLAAATPARAAHGDITLLGHKTLPGAARITDVWGYYDPVTQREYAICGDSGAGVYIVDVTDPNAMTIADHVTGISGFDVKVWSHYVYACDGDATGTDSHIIDIADPANAVLEANTFESAHNIAINASGVMFLQLPGMRVYTLGADPTSPAFAFRFGKFGHDSTPAGNMVYDFTGATAAVNIWRVNNPSRPVLLGTVSGGGITYAHSGDVSSDGNYLYVCDELSVHPIADISVWNVADPAAPTRVTDLADETATVHNLYIVDALAYVAYYTAGFKVYDVTDPAAPVLADVYDTSGYAGEGFNGAFGIYPYAPSGHVYVTDHPNGLYVFDVERDTQTPVMFTSFSASSRDGAVDLEWEVFADEDFSGFRVEREHGGAGVTIAAALPPGTRRHFDENVEPGQRYTYTVTAVRNDGTEFASLAATVETPSVTTRLLPNFPNPFNPSTTIAFDLSETASAVLTVFDARGHLIRTLADGRLRGGSHRFEWDGTDSRGAAVASGAYFYRLTVNGVASSRRMTLLK